MQEELLEQTYAELLYNPDSFDERKRLILSFPVYNIPVDIQNDIIEAYDHFQTNPEDYDGSTGAKENWVTEYEPASMRHDLDYKLYGGSSKGRLYSDLKFLRYKKIYQISSIWRNIQYFAVRWGGSYYQLIHKLKGEYSEVPINKVKLATFKRSRIQYIIELLGIITIVPFTIFFLGAFIMHLKHLFTIKFKR